MNEHRNCTCPASKSGSFQIATDHYSRNFIPTGWKLEYTSLEQHEPQRFLYMTGWCLRCGGQDLQSGISIPDELSGDALLERIYREMEHYRPFEHRRSDGTYPEFVEKLNYIVQKLFMALRRDGRLAILVGDIRTKGSFYRDLRRGDNELDALEKAYGEKLSTFPALSRDIYQSFYSLNVRRQPEDAISEQARRFNAPILNEVMDGEDYPAIKAACEGRQLPAYEAASEFISQVAGNLDELLEKASGKKGALNTLERLEQKRDRSMEELQKLMKQIAQAGPEQLPELEKQAVKAANQAQSQVNQTEAVGHMVRDQMLQNKEAVSGCFAQAVRAAAQKAESVSSALLAWGYGPDSNDPERRAADLELAARVGKSPTLMEVARYLGRLKELMDGKRKNGYAYGRGEKYSLELGGDINRAIASEFAMLAAPETLPLFLRKLQRKALKQYQRREPICKGSGDIICMLDESSSAESQAPWCKAVALALLDIAMRDQRRFAVIHFAGVGDVQTDLFLPGQYDREDVLRCAETFLNGNTDYETPLREALRLMEQEGFENADMVFVTDGECVLPDSFLEKLKAEQSARGFQITGILLDQEDAGFEFSLRESCTNVYRTSQLSRDQIAEQLVVSRVA